MVVDFEHFIATSNGILRKDPSSHAVLTRISRQLFTVFKQLVVWMMTLDSYNIFFGESPLTIEVNHGIATKPWESRGYQEAIEHICGTMTGTSRSRSVADVRELLGCNVRWADGHIPGSCISTCGGQHLRIDSLK